MLENAGVTGVTRKVPWPHMHLELAAVACLAAAGALAAWLVLTLFF